VVPSLARPDAESNIHNLWPNRLGEGMTSRTIDSKIAEKVDVGVPAGKVSPRLQKLMPTGWCRTVP